MKCRKCKEKLFDYEEIENICDTCKYHESKIKFLLSTPNEKEVKDFPTSIFVKIDSIQYEFLKNKIGFLHIKNYPDEWKEICVNGELGRFLFFRFIKDL